LTTLTIDEKRKIRNAAERKANSVGVAIHWNKTDINDAVQAIEDILDSPAFKTQVSDAIDAAAATTFTASEKKWLGGLVMWLKYGRDLA
jgi:hypothetical protein